MKRGKWLEVVEAVNLKPNECEKVYCDGSEVPAHCMKRKRFLCYHSLMTSFHSTFII